KQLNSRGLIPPATRNYVDRDVGAGKVYRYTLAVVREDGSEVQSQTVTVKMRAWTLALYQNCPNPFNPTTTISFTLPDKAYTSLIIYNIEGKLVKTLMNNVMDEGFKEVTWDGRDARGNLVSSGVSLDAHSHGHRSETSARLSKHTARCGGVRDRLGRSNVDPGIIVRHYWGSWKVNLIDSRLQERGGVHFKTTILWAAVRPPALNKAQ
ncbi:unnamed protein product, partial [marine sediment metagenome]